MIDIYGKSKSQQLKGYNTVSVVLVPFPDDISILYNPPLWQLIQRIDGGMQ